MAGVCSLNTVSHQAGCLSKMLSLLRTLGCRSEFKHFHLALLSAIRDICWFKFEGAVASSLLSRIGQRKELKTLSFPRSLLKHSVLMCSEIMRLITLPFRCIFIRGTHRKHYDILRALLEPTSASTFRDCRRFFGLNLPSTVIAALFVMHKIVF